MEQGGHAGQQKKSNICRMESNMCRLKNFIYQTDRKFFGRRKFCDIEQSKLAEAFKAADVF